MLQFGPLKNWKILRLSPVQCTRSTILVSHMETLHCNILSLENDTEMADQSMNPLHLEKLMIYTFFFFIFSFFKRLYQISRDLMIWELSVRIVYSTKLLSVEEGVRNFLFISKYLYLLLYESGILGLSKKSYLIISLFNPLCSWHGFNFCPSKALCSL